MPRIPILESNVNIPQPGVSGVSSEGFTPGDPMLRQEVKKIQEAVNYFTEVDILRRKTKAENNLRAELDAILADASNNYNLDDFDKYQGMIDETIDKHINLVPPGEARMRAEQEFKSVGYNTFSGVRNIKYDRSKQATLFEHGANIQGMLDDVMTYSDARKVESKQKEALSKIDEIFQRGLLTAKQALAEKEDVEGWMKEWQDTKIRGMIALDAGSARVAIVENVYGELTAEESKAYLDIIDVAEKRQKKNAEIELQNAQIENQKNLVTGLISGETSVLDIDDISRLIATGQIRRDFGEAYIEVLSMPDEAQNLIDREKVSVGFSEVINNYLESDDEDFIEKGIDNILKDGASGKITYDEMKVLLGLTINKVNPSLLKKTIDGVLSIPKFFKKVSTGKPPVQAMNESNFEHAMEMNPYLADIPEDGVVMIEARGNKARIYPDGRRVAA